MIKLIKQLLFLAISLYFSSNAIGQAVLPNPGVVYNDDVVPRIDISIHPDTLMAIMFDVQSNAERNATFYWDDGFSKDTVKNIAFRLRGNTSRISAKKSFKIHFTHFGSKKFHGISEMNLNGEHNDPSIIRAKLTWDIMRMAEIEAPRSNYVRLFINGEYRGLYLNVEHINDDYLEKRNKDSKGQLFKCFYGADFLYLGNNPNSYSTKVYEPQNNESQPDYNNFISFLKALDDKNNPDFRCNLEAIFDVDSYLKRMAIEVLVGHWDNPIYNKNNAYLFFNPTTQKFELLTYDTDNTFGIDWFGVNWSTRNIYSWAQSTNNRPIFNNLLAVEEYKKRYGYYIDLFIMQFYKSEKINPHIDAIFNKIKAFRVDDTYASLDYGYTYNDFVKSYDFATGKHVKFGLKQFINLRGASAFQQLKNIDVSPVIENVNYTWTNSECNVSFDVWHTESISLTTYLKRPNGTWQETVAKDDGIFPDIKANDRRYNLQFSYEGTEKVQFYVEAVSEKGQKSRWPFCSYYELNLGYNKTPLLKINEVMASNTSIKDEHGDYDDWIEIYNADQKDVFLGSLYLSDARSNRNKWKLPPIILKPDAFILVWADEQEEQGNLHTNFKLDKDGEFLGIFDNDANSFAPIDTLRFKDLKTNKTKGKYPDGQGDMVDLSSPTPGVSNVVNKTLDVYNNLKIFPNPCSDHFNVCFDDLDLENLQFNGISLFDINGKRSFPITARMNDCYEVNMTMSKPGFYILEFSIGKNVYRSKLIKI